MHQEHDASAQILLSDLFAKLDNLRKTYNILYTVSQCLLDQVMETILENSEPEHTSYLNSAYIPTDTTTP